MDSSGDVSVVKDKSGRIVRAAGPGLVDIQVNGYAGVDFNGPVEHITIDGLGKACRAMRRRGVEAILVTIITDAAEEMIARVRRITILRKQDELLDSMIAGFHIEGPLISGEDGPRGAHPAEHVTTPRQAPHLLDDFQEASDGTVRLLTLAPELPGATELIGRAAEAGIAVALGHHAAGPETIDQAVAAGAKMSTHLGNSSHTMLPRLDNYIQHQLADDRLAASFIADGHHVPWPALKNFIRAKQPSRCVLITDAMSAADMPPGRYRLGRITVEVGADMLVHPPGATYLAGSALTLDRAVMNVTRRCDVPFQTAWAMASTIPAELLSLPAPERIEVDVTEQGFVRR